MTQATEDPVGEVRRLQACINDLISVLALPPSWSGGDELHIVSTLLDGLVGMLHLDFTYARLASPMDGSPTEIVRSRHPGRRPVPPPEVGEALGRAVFDIHEPAIARLGEIVHDLDLKDDRFGSPEAATLGAAIDGLQLACAADGILLEQG
jgi:chromate resistance exported protein